MKKVWLTLACAVFGLGVLAACSKPSEEAKPETPQTPFSGAKDPMDHWELVQESQLPTLVPDGKMAGFRTVLERQIENCRDWRAGTLKKCPNESAHVKLACDEPTLQHLEKLLNQSADWATFYKKAKTDFDWYRFKAGAGSLQVLFTGYNAPLFEGSFKQDQKYKYPLYTRPKDLADLPKPDGTIEWKMKKPDGTYGPYHDRKAIDIDKILAGQGLEIAYMEDPLDIARLQIEGSGMLKTQNPDGTFKEVGVNYAGKNGLPLIPPGKYLRDKGVDPKYTTFDGMKIYFKQNPHELWPALTSNPSYVFFSITGEPPCGTARVHLTPGHTLAVDPTHLPLGTVTLIEGERPEDGYGPGDTKVPKKKFARLAIAQDTGGPIKGGHVDIYFGSDAYAALASNTMYSGGRMFLPKLKTPKPPLQ